MNHADLRDALILAIHEHGIALEDYHVAMMDAEEHPDDEDASISLEEAVLTLMETSNAQRQALRALADFCALASAN